MKKYLKNIPRFNATYYIGAMLLLLWSLSSIVLTGCRKDDRLFTHVDSIAAVPSQFHFFNTYSYDNALSFSVDGLPRETVNRYAFSAYYPSSSAFNTNTAVANSKLININDPANKTLYANSVTNNTFQFKPNTSYIVFTNNSSYDTVRSPMKTNVPTLSYFPEDIYHPFDGTTGIRFLNAIGNPGNNSFQVTVTPNVGQGTTVSLSPVYPIIQPVSAAATYINTQFGVKKIALTVTGSPRVLLSYLPVQLDNGKNYSFFAVGDMTNFLAGIQPVPKLFLVQDGVPSSLRELTLSSVSYPGNLSTTAQVTVINDAYNIKGMLSFGDYYKGTLVTYQGLDVQLNQTKVNVKRWPIYVPQGAPPYEDINDSTYKVTGSSAYPLNLLQRVGTSTSVAPGSYLINVLPGSGFSPTYSAFNYNFQQGLSYTVCLLPDNTTPNKCSQLILQNDQSPDNKYFKLRFINIMGGTTQVDIHTGSPAGPVIASGIGYGQDNAYINLAPNLTAQNLYVTAAGSSTALFQSGTKNTPLSLAFKPGNSGTIYLMGLLPGTPYKGDSGSFGPYVYYNSDAFINANTVLPNAQLFY
jgi:hypothetical protein